MRCYFWGTSNEMDRSRSGHGVISFAIPDWGLQYRAAQVGTAAECEFAALLALLRFTQSNPRLFEGKTLELFTDAVTLVYQLNRQAAAGLAETKLLTLVRAVRQRIPFKLAWVPSEQNAAIQGVLDLAPLSMSAPITYSPFERKRPPKSPPPSSH
jgi:hypothetical protein